jgi:hypothetical protein
LAQQRIEDVRNTPFSGLTAGTITENNVMNIGVRYTVVRTITDSDVIVDTTKAPGPELKQIVIAVTPVGSKLASDTVTLAATRAVVRPGPNRIPNPTTP